MDGRDLDGTDVGRTLCWSDAHLMPMTGRCMDADTGCLGAFSRRLALRSLHPRIPKRRFAVVGRARSGFGVEVGSRFEGSGSAAASLLGTSFNPPRLSERPEGDCLDVRAAHGLKLFVLSMGSLTRGGGSISA